ncbi:hypothetical protein COLO4_38080 [Corchorus olitorius]|uniref:Uncharacterized protein n=1 Tax=Corchorus olitorius TaxID=93759 RepID=A0A1R3FX64_9ROSI|nr:hypothetical protein COLO4_38080 [Corchorus olitorius]
MKYTAGNCTRGGAVVPGLQICSVGLEIFRICSPASPEFRSEASSANPWLKCRESSLNSRLELCSDLFLSPMDSSQLLSQREEASNFLCIQERLGNEGQNWDQELAKEFLEDMVQKHAVENVSCPSKMPTAYLLTHAVKSPFLRPFCAHLGGEDSRQRSGLGNSVSLVHRPTMTASGVRVNGSQSVLQFVEGSGESCSPRGRAVVGGAIGQSMVQPMLGRNIPGIGPMRVGPNLGCGSGLNQSRQTVSHNGQARKIKRWKKAARVSQNYSFDFLGPLSNYQVGQKRASQRSLLIADQPGAMKRSGERGHGCMEAANGFLDKTPAGVDANIGVVSSVNQGEPGGSLCY